MAFVPVPEAFQEALPLGSLSPKSRVGPDVPSGFIQLGAGGAKSPTDASLSPTQQGLNSAKLGYLRPCSSAPFFLLQSPGGLTLPPFNNRVRGQGRKKPFLSHWVPCLCWGREGKER